MLIKSLSLRRQAFLCASGGQGEALPLLASSPLKGQYPLRIPLLGMLLLGILLRLICKKEGCALKRWLCLLLLLLVPVYGLAESKPVLVSVGLSSAGVKVNGRTVNAAGVGKRAPWGVHEADVIYETMVYQTGQTRLGCLFLNQYPETVGPVRSARINQFYLREEWDAAFIYNGDAGWVAWTYMPEFNRGSPLLINTQKNRDIREWRSREKGVKAPDNLSIHLAGFAKTLDHSGKNVLYQSGDTGNAGTAANLITLDWGNDEWSVQLHYEINQSKYLMDRNNAPFLSYPSAQRNENAVQISFDHVIIQYSDYEWPSRVLPVMSGVGAGKADYYFDGQLVEGTWERKTASSPTRYLDSQGNEMHFKKGTIYIAQFPSVHHRTVSNSVVNYVHSPQE